jgi:A/G-specific adenine glycosylase
MDDSVPHLFSVDEKRLLRARLRTWFRRHARDLPWRRTRDPYHVWISEVMLQQTQVAAVMPYFERFLDRWPNVPALAEAPQQEVLRVWEGLGYYRRARQLHAAAKLIVQRHAGVFPADAEAVRALPGIGRYTAGAILSIAFDQRQPILEANSQRVLSRLAAVRGDLSRADAQRHLWSLAEDFLPRTGAGEFNQALMELGSAVCTHRSPRCEACPLAAVCVSRREGLTGEIPAAKRKTLYEDVSEAAVVVRERGSRRVLVRQCGADERWAGLWDFPRFAIKSDDAECFNAELIAKVAQLTGLSIEPLGALATIKHGVTRFRITLHCHQARRSGGRLRRDTGSLRWIAPEQLRELPLSVTGRRISELLMRDEE